MSFFPGTQTPIRIHWWCVDGMKIHEKSAEIENRQMENMNKRIERPEWKKKNEKAWAK